MARRPYVLNESSARDEYTSSVTVRIEEMRPFESTDDAQWLVHGIAECAEDGMFSKSTFRRDSSQKPCKRSRTNEESPSQLPAFFHPIPRRYSAWESRNHSRNKDACVRNNGSEMRLPCFKTLGISTAEPIYLKSSTSYPPDVISKKDGGHQLLHDNVVNTGIQTHMLSGCGVMGLPTPPDEAEIKLEEPIDMESLPVINVLSTSQNDAPDTNRESHSASRSQTRPSSISLPPSTQAQDSMPIHGGSTYLAELMVSSLGDLSSPDHLQVVSQCLPPQVPNDAVKCVLDEFLEAIAARAQDPPYVTVTLAVNESHTTHDIPTSPPATPSTTHGSDDYFTDQTVFMHAAKVPTYQHKVQSLHSIARPTGVIAAPASINVSLLERYLPPTTGEEIQDFFGTTGRSYLADRLSELSSNDGSLLLVYPTKEGGRTFAKRYLGPVIDPFLRQFVLVNNLTMHAASKIGRMVAIDQMLTFEEMRRRVETVCQSMTQRASPRGLRGIYKIHHAEVGQVELDRSVWVDWFVEQEQSRIRDDLVQYHKAGGRMPEPRGQAKIEVTTGILAREVLTGIKNSTVDSGHAGIELGVFVIRRSAQQ